MLGFIVRVQLSDHMVVLLDQEHRSEAQTPRQAVKAASQNVPRLLASLLMNGEQKLDSFSIEFQFSRKMVAGDVYRWLCERATACGSLFYLIDDSDDEQIEILPERPKA